MSKVNMREKIFKYVKEKYKIKPDYPFSTFPDYPVYPFSTFPDYPVLRHEDNRKWFALIMEISGEKLGLKGAEYVDIMNVKLGDPMLVDVQIPCLWTCLSASLDIFMDTTLPGETGSPFCWTERFPLKKYASGSTKVTQ